MPSVTMMAGMRPSVTSAPLSAPASPPTATPAKSGSRRPPVESETAPAAIAHRPSIEPVEMSISPHSITWLTARATTPSTATESTIDSRLEAVRNRSLASVKATRRTARNASAGASGRTRNLRSTASPAPRSADARASLIAGLLSGPLAAPGGGGHDPLLRGSFSIELSGDAALAHNQDPVGHGKDLLQLTGYEQYGLSLFGQVVHEAVDLRLGAHVDAAGRLVEQQDGRFARQRLGDDHFLLIAAREPGDRVGHPGAPDGEFLGEPVGDLPLRAGHETEPGDPVQYAQGDVVLDGEGQDQTLRAPLLRHVEYAPLHGRLGRADPDLFPAHEYLAGVRRTDAEDGLRQLGAARPDEPGEAQDLAAAQRQVHGLELTLAGQSPDLEGHLAGAARAPGEELAQGPAHHEADQLLGVQFGGGRGGDVPAVAQHGDAVGYLEDLLQPMRDVDDAHVAGGEVLDDAEELPRLPVGQRRGRLVHHHRPGVAHQGPGDGHDLPVGRREPLDRGRHVELDAQSVQPPSRLVLHGAPVEATPAGAGLLAAHEQVLGDRELGEQVELLGDHGDAGSLGVARRGESSGLAVHLQAALVGLVEPVHDLHERTLAGPVLAHQGVNLSRTQVEVHVLHGDHTAE